MNIVERIKDNFNKGYFGKSMAIPELPEEFPAWTYKQNNYVGVVIPVDYVAPFSEEFSKVKICTVSNVEIDNHVYNTLMLTSYAMESRNEFALLCEQFVNPGNNGENRKELIANPEKWWRRWRDLLGNISSTKSAYDVFAELTVVERLLAQGKHPRWTGGYHATHDIELSDSSVEVKSTTQRYGYEVTISSVYQLCPVDNKTLNLAFIRLEKSQLGRSINDVVLSLTSSGYDNTDIENVLTKAGLEIGRVARNEKYKILEWKLYPVDSVFPTVTESSFKNDRLPQNVIRFTYTVDLSGLSGQNQIKSKDELGCTML